MRPLNLENLSAADVTTLIRDTPDVEFGAGVELIDRSLSVLADLTDYLHGGSITRQSYANLHGSATLEISKQLDWGNAIMRPYVTLDGYRFNMGAYFADTNITDLQTGIYTVTGHDVLLALADRVGQTYSVPAGTPVLAKVEELLVQQGFTRYAIDQAMASATLPSARPWAIDDNTTWLTIVNDLLASVGYAGVWSDWDGRLRCHPYVSPVDRAAEWTYTGDEETSQLSINRVINYDYFDVPNRWVAVRQNNIAGTTPVEGDGIYTKINQSDGLTSIDARQRTITSPLILVDAADQAALVAAVDSRAAADMTVPTTIELGVWHPNPLHWHFDRCFVTDPELGMRQVLVTRWKFPLPPSTEDMSQVWSVIGQ